MFIPAPESVPAPAGADVAGPGPGPGPEPQALPLVIGGQSVGIEDVDAVASGARPVCLSHCPSFRATIERGPALLEQMWRSGSPVYGVTTGVGASCVRDVPAGLIPLFSRNLARFHGCGLGRYFSPRTTASIILVRLVSLARGYSAVRFELLQRLCLLLQKRVYPLIPEEGSVGASGDLTPLSYLAAFLMGERDALYNGRVVPSATVHRELALEPLTLRPKEGLAIMNGTAVMTAVACEAYARAEMLARLATRLTGLLCQALLGNPAHFDPRLFEQKPHPGQARVAGRIACDLQYTRGAKRSAALPIQDPYSLRCAPHIIGVLEDALPWMRTQIETEINSTNDNPMIDPESGDALHGGNFYGGHIGYAMDCLKLAVANLADLMDRQMALLIDAGRNRGLPLNLSGAAAETLPINHGFKAVQIACSAWTAEALRHATAATLFSRSTESHNQDKVSLGTIAARDALRVIELTEQVLAGTLFATVQGIDLRLRSGELSLEALAPDLVRSYHAVRGYSAFVDEDRPLDDDLRRFVRALAQRQFPCEWSTELEGA
jgi:histidine ammonia-lyase